MKELLSKSYLLFSGLVSLAFHSFLLSLLLWNLQLCVIRLHHKCLWVSQEMFTGDLGTDCFRDSTPDLPSHAPHPVLWFSFSLPILCSPDSTSCWGILSVFNFPSMSQILYPSQLEEEGTFYFENFLLTLCNLMDYTVHGILQARILKWVAILFSRGSSPPRDRTQAS